MSFVLRRVIGILLQLIAFVTSLLLGIFIVAPDAVGGGFWDGIVFAFPLAFAVATIVYLIAFSYLGKGRQEDKKGKLVFLSVGLAVLVMAVFLLPAMIFSSVNGVSSQSLPMVFGVSTALFGACEFLAVFFLRPVL